MNIFKKRYLAITLFTFTLCVFIFGYVPGLYKLIVVAAAVPAGVLLYKRRKLYTAVCTSVAAAALLSFCYINLYSDPVKNLVGNVYVLTGVVTSVDQNEDYAHRSELRITAINGKSAYYRCILTSDRPLEIKESDTVTTAASLFDPESDEIFAANEDYYRSKGVVLWAKVADGTPDIIEEETKCPEYYMNIIRSRVSGVFEKYLGEDAANLAKSLSVGDKSGLSSDIKSSFKRIGIAHMLAISGLHLSVLCEGLKILMLKTGCRRKTTAACATAFALVYLFISGFAPSLFRAALMYAVFNAGLLLRRENDGVTSLSFAAAVIVLLSPYAVYDSGFMLSVTATFGIVTVFPYMYERLISPVSHMRFPMRLLQYPLSIISVTLCALMFSLPVIFVHFGNISLFTIPANMLLSVPFSIILYCIPVILLLSPLEFAAAPFAALYEYIITLFLKAVKTFASIPSLIVSLQYPFSIFIIAAFFLSLLIMSLKKVRSPLWSFCSFGGAVCIYAVCVIVFNSVTFGTASVYAAARGTNDMLLLGENGKTMICDISDGSNAPFYYTFELIESKLYDSDLDYYMVTHYHKLTAHTFEKTVRAYYVKNAILPEPYDEQSEELFDEMRACAEKFGVNVHVLGYGEPFVFEDISITEGFPEETFLSSHNGVFLTVTANGKTLKYLSSGCITTDRTIIDADYVILGQHGSSKYYESTIQTGAQRIIVTGDKIKYDYSECGTVPEIMTDTEKLGYIGVTIKE